MVRTSGPPQHKKSKYQVGHSSDTFSATIHTYIDQNEPSGLVLQIVAFALLMFSVQ